MDLGLSPESDLCSDLILNGLVAVQLFHMGDLDMAFASWFDPDSHSDPTKSK